MPPIDETLSLKIPCGGPWSDLFDKKLLRDSVLKAVRAKPGQDSLDHRVEFRIAGKTQFKQMLPWDLFTMSDDKKMFFMLAADDVVDFLCEDSLEIELDLVSVHTARAEA